MSVRSVIGWRTNGAQGSADTTHGRRGAGPGRRCPIPVASDPSGPPCVPGTGKHPQNSKEALVLRLLRFTIGWPTRYHEGREMFARRCPMNPYSMDLRERVAAAVDLHEGSQRQIARRFRVSLSFITRLLRTRRRTGSLAPKPHGGGHPPALDRAGRVRLRRLVRKQPDATLEELAGRVGIRCSRMAIFRTLRKLEITRKKKSLHAQERDTPRVRRM